MNCSIYGADRTTHLKIVVIALVASIGVAGLGIAARASSDDGNSRTAHVIKAGQRASGRTACRRAASQAGHSAQLDFLDAEIGEARCPETLTRLLSALVWAA
jgi:hypothetical protein